MARDEQWRIPNALWARIEPPRPPGEPHRFGGHRPRGDDRRAMGATFFVLRTGCQRTALTATGICSSSSAHRRFPEWSKAGVCERPWAPGGGEDDRLTGIDWAWQGIGWAWQALDGALVKAPLGGGGNRPRSDRPGQAGGRARPAHGG